MHGLCGENGSGKSTLLEDHLRPGRTPTGAASCSTARETRFGDPSEALAAGIATVTQERTLVPDLSVAENIFLGPRKAALVARDRLARDAAAGPRGARPARAAPSTSTRRVGRLRPDLQQLVEIARALSTDARVLILDEPTSSLADDEVESLFAAVRRLKGSGVATVFVSHRLREVFAARRPRDGPPRRRGRSARADR